MGVEGDRLGVGWEGEKAAEGDVYGIVGDRLGAAGKVLPV